MNAPPVPSSSGATTASGHRVSTATLLRCGVAGGPLLIGVTLIQAVTREGFDLARHPLSLLSLGDLGWIQIANFIVVGSLFIACAIGMRRALRTGRAGTWGPRLIAAFGVSMIWGGVFVADPYRGFPPGAADLEQMSWHGALHAAAPIVASLALTAACCVFARRFWPDQRGWAITCIATAVASFTITSAAAATEEYRLMFVGGAIVWAWASMMAARLTRALPNGRT